MQEDLLIKILDSQNQMQQTIIKILESQNQMQQDITGMKQDIKELKVGQVRLESKIDRVEKEIIEEFKETITYMCSYVDKKIKQQVNEPFA